MAKYLEGLEFIQLVKPGGADTTIMQVSRPHVVGRVAFIDQRDVDEVERFMLQLANGATLAKVPGYSIFVLPGGTLDNAPATSEEVVSVLRSMSQYILFDIVGEKKGRWLRYQEGVNMDAEMEKGRYYRDMKRARRAAKLAQDED